MTFEQPESDEPDRQQFREPADGVFDEVTHDPAGAAYDGITAEAAADSELADIEDGPPDDEDFPPEEASESRMSWRGLRGRVGRMLSGLRRDGDAQDTLPSQNPDGPYERKDLVRDPRTGEMVPAMDLLDEAHLAIRMRELVDQANDPRPEAVPIPPAEVPQHAFDLLMGLQDVATAEGWQVEEVPLEDGRLLRNCNNRVADPDDPRNRDIFYTAQLSYASPDSEAPEYGNLSVTEPVPGWMREYYFQANPAARYESDEPTVYYNDYPFHEEELGRPEHNTEFALEQARRLLARARGLI